jgi:hypothetical protein
MFAQKSKILLAIDTGTRDSAYAVVDTETYRIIESKKVPNAQLMTVVRKGYYDMCVVEMFSSYGNRSGTEVFDAIVMVGQVKEACATREVSCTLIKRKEVKMHICNSMSAKDADVIMALKDRFGEKGTKDSPGWFFGMKSDGWQAYGLAVTFLDLYVKEGEHHAL